MSRFEDETFLSAAAVDGNGVVTRANPWLVNGPIVPGVLPSAQDQADYLARWFPGGPDETVHVWGGGGVEVPVGGTLDGVRPADATAPSRVPVGGVR